MKKRLLITSALMTAVLGASLATGTYAWYAVATGNVGKEAGTSANIQTTVNEYSVGVDTIVIGFGTPTAPAELSDDEGKTYYVDGTYKYQNTSADKTTQIGSCSITANWKGTNEETHKSLATQKVTAYIVTDNAQVQLLKDNTSVLAANEVDYIKVVATVQADGTLDLDEDMVYFAVRPAREDVTAEAAGVGGTLSVTFTQPQ